MMRGDRHSSLQILSSRDAAIAAGLVDAEREPSFLLPLVIGLAAQRNVGQ